MAQSTSAQSWGSGSNNDRPPIPARVERLIDPDDTVFDPTSLTPQVCWDGLKRMGTVAGITAVCKKMKPRQSSDVIDIARRDSDTFRSAMEKVLVRGPLDHHNSTNKAAFQRLLGHRVFKTATPRPEIILFCIVNHANMSGNLRSEDGGIKIGLVKAAVLEVIYEELIQTLNITAAMPVLIRNPTPKATPSPTHTNKVVTRNAPKLTATQQQTLSFEEALSDVYKKRGQDDMEVLAKKQKYEETRLAANYLQLTMERPQVVRYMRLPDSLIRDNDSVPKLQIMIESQQDSERSE